MHVHVNIHCIYMYSVMSCIKLIYMYNCSCIDLYMFAWLLSSAVQWFGDLVLVSNFQWPIATLLVAYSVQYLCTVHIQVLHSTG